MGDFVVRQRVNLSYAWNRVRQIKGIDPDKEQLLALVFSVEDLKAKGVTVSLSSGSEDVSVLSGAINLAFLPDREKSYLAAKLKSSFEFTF